MKQKPLRLALAVTLACPMGAARAQNATIETPVASLPVVATTAARVEGISGGRLAPAEAVLPLIGADGLDTVVSGRVPNYLRLLAASHPQAVGPFAHLLRVTLYGGTLPPQVKAAMGLQIARDTGSAYLAAHLERVLRTLPSGSRLLSTSTDAGASDRRESLALSYTHSLTQNIHGVSDAQFARTRGAYNDAQIVELTVTACFFNYFARLCQGANLPLEAWASTPPAAPPALQEPEMFAPRISLASDEELQSAARLSNPSSELKKGLGIAVANSQRAMLRVPDIANAWWAYGQAVRAQSTLGRETQLQISFAVSMANGCRYCTLHQVAGLRRLGVQPAKLLAMQKDDSMLDAKEKACVAFARKLTKTPSMMQTSDLDALQTALGSEAEAADALLQTCMFSFMNRFTDGLHLPSEDEAVRTYNDIYGPRAYETFSTTPR